MGKLTSRQSENADTIRQRNQRAAWDAYYGNFPKPLKVSKTGNDDNIIVNRCRPIVDKSVSFLVGSPITFEFPKSTKKKAVGFIEQTWSNARQATTLHKLSLNSCVTGQLMVKLVPAVPFPRLIILDPTLFTVETAPDDIDTVVSFTQTWKVEGPDNEPIQKRQITAQVTPGRWLITDQQQTAGSDEWQQLNVAEWPYPFAPIVTGQNLPAPNQFWGKADLGLDLIQMNKDLNFIYSLMSRIIRFHAFPKTVGKGFDGSTLKVAADGTVILPSPESSMEILEMKGDLSASIHMADEIRSAMDELSHVPSISLGTIKDIPKGTVSGVALQVMYEPLLELTRLKQTLVSDFLVEVNRRLLSIGGYAADDCIVHWPNIVPTDDAQTAQVATLWASLDVSRKTIYTKLGLDPELEQKNLDEQEVIDTQKAVDKAALLPPPPPVMPGSQQDANAGEKSETERPSIAA